MGSSNSKKVNRIDINGDNVLSEILYDNLPMLASNIVTAPVYYKSSENEYIIIMTSSTIERFDIMDNTWSQLACLPPNLKPTGADNVINRATNTLYIIGCEQQYFSRCNLHNLSPWSMLTKSSIGLKSTVSTQSVHVSSLNELHVFGSDNARSYHFVFDETGIYGEQFTETEGINDNEALIHAKMIHIKYKNELLVFGGIKSVPFELKQTYNQTIWRYKLYGNSKWEINETQVPFLFGSWFSSAFEVMVAYECIVVIYIKGTFWFWDLIRNEWHAAGKTLPGKYNHVIITDNNMIHCISNGSDTDERKHIRFRLLDIMPLNLHDDIKQSFSDLVYKYIELHCKNKMPLEVMAIILHYFELF